MSLYKDGNTRTVGGRIPHLDPFLYLDGVPPVNPSGGGGSGNWTDAGGYLYPSLGSTMDVVMGATSGPVASEKVRVKADTATSAIRSEGHLEIADNAAFAGPAGAWNGPHLVMGTLHFWVDSLERTRIKNGAPTSETDGIILGTNS